MNAIYTYYYIFIHITIYFIEQITLGNKINATPVHFAKIGKFQDTITSSKIVVSEYLKKHFTGRNFYFSNRYL